MHQVYEQVAKEDQNVSSLRTNNPRDDFEFEGSSTFVEIESYETLKAKVEKRGRELAKLTNVSSKQRKIFKIAIDTPLYLKRMSLIS